MTLLAHSAPKCTGDVLQVRRETPDAVIEHFLASLTRTAPVVLLVDEDDDRAPGRTTYAEQLASRGARVIRWICDDDGLPRFERLLATTVLVAPAVVTDVSTACAADALAAVETAWHAGSLTVLRTSPSPAEGPAERAAAAAAASSLADVLVCTGLAPVSDSGPAVTASHFEADDVLELMGTLTPPETDLTLSVLVTTYDRPDELAACLEALTRQTLAPERFDVVVVDDASPVDVSPVLQQFAPRLRLELVRMRVNSGAGAARGAGLQLCRGDIVLLMDDDDLPAPRVLAEHLRKHDELRGEEVTVLGHTVVRPQGRSDVLSRHVTREGRQYFSYGTMRDGQRLPWHWFWGGRSSAKRSLLDRFPFRGAFMEDTDAAWRAHSALERQGLALSVVYARRSVQVAASPLPLSAMRRRQVKMGRATGLFFPTTGDDLQDKLPGARSAVAARRVLPPRVLADLAGRSAEAMATVRSGPRGSTAAGRLSRVDVLLKTDLAAHHAIGLLAATTMTRAASQGRCTVLGIDADHEDLLPVVAATAPGDRLRIVVRLAPDQSPDVLVSELTTSLTGRGRALDSIGDVELRVSPQTVELMDDIDVVLSTHGSTAPQGPCGLVLFGLSSIEWVTWLASGGTAAGGLR